MADVIDLAAWRAKQANADSGLSPTEKAEFATHAAFLLEIPYCPWTPNWFCGGCGHKDHPLDPVCGECGADCTDTIPIPSPQVHFLLDFGREALYGGAAGGGKSVAILMAASQFLHVPGYAALILRKSFSDLTKPLALMDLAASWWGGRPGCKYDTQTHTWSFECHNARGEVIGHSQIVFGALENENDRFKYAGGAYQFIGWDEVTQQRERDYRFLFSRVRRVKDPANPLSRVPIRVRATANPGGIGHDWVNKRFVGPWTAWQKGTHARPKRNFWPAIIEDNPALDAADYIESLEELTSVEKAQLMKGDWNIRPDGRMFKAEWFKPIAHFDVPAECEWVRFWDLAATDPDPGKEPDWTAGALVGRDASGNYYIVDMQHWQCGPGEVMLRIKAAAGFDSHRVSVWMEQEPGSSGKLSIHVFRTQVLDEYDFHGKPSSGQKHIRARPVAAKAEAGYVYMVEGPWNDDFLNEIEIFPDKGAHDDQVDALSGAMGVLAKQAMTNVRFNGSGPSLHVVGKWKPDQTPNMDRPEWEGKSLDLAREVEVEMDVEQRKARVRQAWAM